jgi:lambda family phage portal protein
MSFMGWLRGDGASLESSSSVSTPHETRWLGASHVVRSLANWFAKVGSGTSDLPANEQRTMRARSRDAFRSDMLARAVLTRARTNIVGTGLMCRPSVDHAALDMEPDAAEALNAELQANWERWADDPLECDAEATLDIYGLQSLTLLSAMLSGDCIALTPFEERQGGISGLKVQLIEADRVENPNCQANRVGLIDGVALSPIGMPLGYWIRSNHPGDSIVTAVPATWAYFPAFGEETGRRRVLHVWNDKERPGQVRGAPYLAPILEPLRQLRRWTDNELMAAVVSAMFTVFIKKQAEQLDADGNPIPFFPGPVPTIPTNPDGTHPDPATFAPPTPANNISMGNGAIIEGAPGDDFVFANPARPNARFDPFFVALAKQIGAALEIPLDELMLQYNASYSAARAAMLQAWRFYISRRTTLTQQFCQPLYGLWMDEEVASGRISLPGYADPIRRRAYSRAIWIGPARGAMDEFKEAQAAEKRIEIGVSTEAMEAAAMTGESRDAIYAQRLREINQRKADGTWALRPAETVRISPPTDPNAEPVPPSDPIQQEEEPEDAT